jgi:hypothetical protein
MFVGHYGVSFAVKAVDRRIPLWLLFIAVQFVDVLWGVFVLLGIERVRIMPGITASNPFDLYYMPYTHSLVASVLWAGAAIVAYTFVRSWRGSAILVGVAVLSHWVLDFVVHRPNLSLYDNTMKVGLGLWNYPAVALTLEAGLLFGSLIWYLRRSTALRPLGHYGFWIFGVVMVLIQVWIFFGPPPTSPDAAAITALVAYAVFAGVARWLEQQRKQ